MISNLEDVFKKEDDYGNKARNLSVLINQGILVPKGIALSYEQYLDYLNSGNLTEDFEEEILQRLVNIPKPYAVRSSANAEDSEKKSYAGQFRTILGVSKKEICKSVKKVYDSAINFNNSHSDCDIKMGAVIQEMIDSEISGVLFTYDIINQDPNALMIELSKGRCENIVSGKTNPSLYVIDKSAGKTLLFEKGSQNISLSNDQKYQILFNAKRIEEIFGKPQDIEFLFNLNKFYCLQSRDITTI